MLIKCSFTRYIFRAREAQFATTMKHRHLFLFALFYFISAAFASPGTQTDACFVGCGTPMTIVGEGACQPTHYHAFDFDTTIAPLDDKTAVKLSTILQQNATSTATYKVNFGLTCPTVPGDILLLPGTSFADTAYVSAFLSEMLDVNDAAYKNTIVTIYARLDLVSHEGCSCDANCYNYLTKENSCCSYVLDECGSSSFTGFCKGASFTGGDVCQSNNQPPSTSAPPQSVYSQPPPSMDWPPCMNSCDFEKMEGVPVCTGIKTIIATGCMYTCDDTTIQFLSLAYAEQKCGTSDELISLVKQAGEGPKTTTVVTSAISLQGYSAADFTDSVKAQFITGLASALKVDAAAIKITEVAAARRHLLSGVTVHFTVTVEGKEAEVTTATSAITTYLSNTNNNGAITTSLNNAGLTNASVTAVQTPTQSTTSASRQSNVVFALLASASVMILSTFVL